MEGERWSDEVIIAGWNAMTSQGNEGARSRGKGCVMIAVPTQALAVRLTRAGLSVFALPSCFHYDGVTLSLDCTQAGSGTRDLKFSMWREWCQEMAIVWIERARARWVD